MFSSPGEECSSGILEALLFSFQSTCLTSCHNIVFLRACVCVAKAWALKLCFVLFFVCVPFLSNQSQSIVCRLVGRAPRLPVSALNELVGGWITPLYHGTLREISHYVKLKPLIRKTTAGKLCKPPAFFPHLFCFFVFLVLIILYICLLPIQTFFCLVI